MKFRIYLLDNGCCQHDMAYRDFRDLTKKAVFDIVLCDKSVNIGKIPNMMDTLLRAQINLLLTEELELTLETNN